MAQYGGKDITLTLEDAPGGTARAVEVTGQLALKIVSEMMDTTPLGSEWEEQNPGGLRKVEPFPLEGLFDDTASTGFHTVCQIKDADAAPGSVGRQLVATLDGSSLTFTVTGHLSDYEVTGVVRQKTKARVMYTPSGSGVWSA